MYSFFGGEGAFCCVLRSGSVFATASLNRNYKPKRNHNYLLNVLAFDSVISNLLKVKNKFFIFPPVSCSLYSAVGATAPFTPSAPLRPWWKQR